jgi:hypothetical protein
MMKKGSAVRKNERCLRGDSVITLSFQDSRRSGAA